MTRPPARANWTEIARPMPRVPPATRKVLPSRENILSMDLVLSVPSGSQEGFQDFVAVAGSEFFHRQKGKKKVGRADMGAADFDRADGRGIFDLTCPDLGSYHRGLR